MHIQNFSWKSQIVWMYQTILYIAVANIILCKLKNLWLLYTVKNYSVFYSVLLIATANDCFRNLQWSAVIFLHLFSSNIVFFTV